MSWAEAGLQPTIGGFYSSGVGNNRVLVGQFNSQIMSQRGNRVVEGCAPSVGGETDLTISGTHLVIASGQVNIGGYANIPFTGANIDLNAAHSALMSTTETRYVLVTIEFSGGEATINTTNGSVANEGFQETPDYPQDEVAICIVYLVETDETMDANNIGDWREFSDSGIYGSVETASVLAASAFDIVEFATGDVAYGTIKVTSYDTVAEEWEETEWEIYWNPNDNTDAALLINQLHHELVASLHTLTFYWHTAARSANKAFIQATNQEATNSVIRRIEVSNGRNLRIIDFDTASSTAGYSSLSPGTGQINGIDLGSANGSTRDEFGGNFELRKAIDMNNQDIAGVNALFFDDPSDPTAVTEGVIFSTNSLGNVNLSAVDSVDYIKFGADNASDLELRLVNSGVGLFNLNVLGLGTFADLTVTGTTTTLGTVTSGLWTATAIGKTYLDTDTAFLSDNQSFTGEIIFSNAVFELTGLAGTIGDGFLAQLASSGRITYRTFAEIASDLSLEIGTDVLAQQTIGIGDNNLVEVDHSTTASSGELARFTTTGIESRSNAEIKTQLGYMTDLVDDETPSLGSNVDLNDFAVTMELQNSSGATLTLGDICVIDDNDAVDDAFADGTEAQASGMLVMCLEATLSDTSTGTFAVTGVVTLTSHGFTIGNKLYLDTVSPTADLPTITAPSLTGEFVRIIGYAIDTHKIFFNPDSTWVEIA